MSKAAYDFNQAAAKALGDRKSRAILHKAIGHIRVLRQRSVNAMPDFAERQARAVAVREKTLSRLPDLLERLEASVVAAGGNVHFAEDAASASALVTRLLAERGVPHRFFALM